MLRFLENIGPFSVMLSDDQRNTKHTLRLFVLSRRKIFIPSILISESEMELSKWESVIAIISNLHNSCKHLSSSTLFLKLLTFRCATLISLVE